MTRKLVLWSLCGATAGLALGIVDATRLAVLERQMFLDTLELMSAMLWTIGACAGGGLIISAALGAAVEGILTAGTRAFAANRERRATLTFAAVSWPLWASTLWSLTSGPRASAWPFRPWAVGLTAAILSLATVGVIAFAIRWSYRSVIRSLGLVAIGIGLASAAIAADSLILVRLYPLFHIGLSLVALLCLALPLRQLLNLPWRLPALRTSVKLIAAVLILGAWSTWSILHSQNPRYVIGDRTVNAGDMVEAVARLAPQRSDDFTAVQTEQIESAHNDLELDVSLPVRPGASLFLITIDAMRADRIGATVQSRRPMPNLERFAKDNVIFTRAYTPYPHTSYAISSLLTGKYTHALFEVPGAPPVHETWPQILTRFRYRTAGFFTKAIFFIDRARFEPYSRTNYGFSYRKVDYLVPASERVSQVFEFLEHTAAESPLAPVFVWTHFFEAHEPYDPNCNRFGDEPVERYDCELAIVDEALRSLLERIEHDYPDAIVIITADHGEEFDDHGGRYHGTTLYDEQVSVPLVVRVPGLPPRSVAAPVSLVDLLGTSLLLLDIPVPARVRSRDLRPLLMGQATGPEPTAFAEVGSQVMLAQLNHKLVCDEDRSLCSLYDLKTDPKERRSVAENHPELVRDLRGQILSMRRSHGEVELRPVQTDQGKVAWPESIRRAMAGDRRVCDALPQVIASSTSPLPLRRKAAELLRGLWGSRPAEQLPDPQSEADPEVSTWLWLARLESGETSAAEPLWASATQLDKTNPARHEAALSLLRSDHPQGAAEVGALVLDTSLPPQLRIAGLTLLADFRYRKLAPSILPLVDEYQLTLVAATALGKFKNKQAVPTLLARLVRERFPERKAVIATALADIGDRQAIPALAEQLFETPPAPGLLEALVRLAGIGTAGRTFKSAGKGQAFVRINPAAGHLRRAPGPAPLRIIVRAKTPGQAGSLELDCGVQGVPLVLGSEMEEGFVDLTSCKPDTASPRVRLSLGPSTDVASIESIAILSLAIANPGQIQ